MDLAVGTTNKAKLLACSEVFKEALPGSKINIKSIEVESNVSAMPMDNEEIFTGALNRANVLAELDKNADYYVGLEGGVQKGPQDRLYLLGWAVIIRAVDGVIGSGHSAGVALPNDLSEALFEGKELGPLVQAKMSDTSNEIRHSLGTNGILTKGLYPRTKEFEDAIRCALGPLI